MAREAPKGWREFGGQLSATSSSPEATVRMATQWLRMSERFRREGDDEAAQFCQRVYEAVGLYPLDHWDPGPIPAGLEELHHAIAQTAPPAQEARAKACGRVFTDFNALVARYFEARQGAATEKVEKKLRELEPQLLDALNLELGRVEKRLKEACGEDPSAEGLPVGPLADYLGKILAVDRRVLKVGARECMATLKHYRMSAVFVFRLLLFARNRGRRGEHEQAYIQWFEFGRQFERMHLDPFDSFVRTAIRHRAKGTVTADEKYGTDAEKLAKAWPTIESFNDCIGKGMRPGLAYKTLGREQNPPVEPRTMAKRIQRLKARFPHYFTAPTGKRE